MRPMLTRRRVMLARAVAMAADLVQVVAFPLFLSGAPGIADGVMDLVVCITLTGLVGWHIAFLPSFVGEALPFVDLVPMWTVAVFFATRDWNDTIAGAKALPESLPPEPPKRR